MDNSASCAIDEDDLGNEILQGIFSKINAIQTHMAAPLFEIVNAF